MMAIDFDQYLHDRSRWRLVRSLAATPRPAPRTTGDRQRRFPPLVFWMVLTIASPIAASAEDGAVTCATCHRQQAEQLADSVHNKLSCRQCHGGADQYDLAPDRLSAFLAPDAQPTGQFAHGEDFKGKPERAAVPNLCGTCHANVELMNPYGIRTDQLARYWTSGHGKTLTNKHDDRVAVCIDCHGTHDVLTSEQPASRTYPLNVPDTCAHCHANAELMADFDLPVEVVDEYRHSVHGDLLLNQKDTGAPTCATCHGNHSAMPPGFATVGAVCGKCHAHAAAAFASSVHAQIDGFEGCVQCHGGPEGSHFHLIQRITKDTGVMIQRYEHLLSTQSQPSPEEITTAIHPDPQQIMRAALPKCLDCHDEPQEDESLAKLFSLLDQIAAAERHYVATGRRLDEAGKGVLLVDRQRFLFSDAKTNLIELAPLQHTLSNEQVSEKVDTLNKVCDQVNADLSGLDHDLQLRHWSLVPIWLFAVGFSFVLYVKYKQLHKQYVKPLPDNTRERGS